MHEVARTDEHAHDAGTELLWQESWYFDFFADDGSMGGYVRLGVYPNLKRVWYWAMLVRPGQPLVAVVDHEVAIPRTRGSLMVRAERLWADHVCETPLDHWSVANEAHAIALDDPLATYGRMLGEVVPVAFDLEWETDGTPYRYRGVTRYEVSCRVHGEIHVGSEVLAVDGHGQRDHSWGVRDWWQFGWCWSAGRLDDGCRFHGVEVRVPDTPVAFGYVQPRSDGLVPLGRVTAEEVVDDSGLPTRAQLAFEAADSSVLELDVEPLAFAPVLLTADDGRVSRFPRALSRFVAADGRQGLGWIEWNQPQSRP